MIIALYIYAMSRLQIQTKVNSAQQKSTKILQTLQGMLKSSWSLSLYPILPILWIRSAIDVIY